MTDTPSIFITGAGSGIGAAAAQHFAAKGWRVGLADRDFAAAHALAKPLQQRAFAVDVVDPESVQAAMAEFAADGGMTVLFNSAGLLDMHRFDQAEMAKLTAMLDVNVKGVITCIRAALPYLQSAPEGAHVITMSSAAAIYGVPDLAVYSASKFAVRGLTEALNIELEAQNIWVCDVMVGYVDTPMLSKADETAKSVGLAGVHATPAMVAQTVFEATQSKRVHWFVREDDRNAQAHFDATPIEDRRDVIKPATGY